MAERIGIVKTDKQRGGSAKSADPSRDRQTNKSSGSTQEGSRKTESSRRPDEGQRKIGKNE